MPKQAKTTKKQAEKPAKTKRCVGRPRREFTQAEIRLIGRLAYERHTNNDIAERLKTDRKTLEHNFAGLLQQKRAERRDKALAMHTKALEAGSVPHILFELKSKEGWQEKGTAALAAGLSGMFRKR